MEKPSRNSWSLDELEVSLCSREAASLTRRSAKKIRHNLGIASLSGWDGALLDAAELLRGDEVMDPFLRYSLLLRTLEYAQDGNALLTSELEQTVSNLHDPEIDLTTLWMNPEVPATSRMRNLAAKKLKSVVVLKPIWDRARQREQALRDRIVEPVSSIGWLAADEQKGWQCYSAWTPDAEYGLWVAVPDAGEKSVRTLDKNWRCSTGKGTDDPEGCRRATQRGASYLRAYEKTVRDRGGRLSGDRAAVHLHSGFVAESSGPFKRCKAEIASITLRTI